MILSTTRSSRTMFSFSCVKPSRCFQCSRHGCLPAGSLPRGAAKAPPFTSPQAHSLIFPKSLGVERLYSKLQWPIIQCIYQFPVIWRFTLKKKKKSSNKCSIKNRKHKWAHGLQFQFRNKTTSILVDARTDGFQRLYIRVYETKPRVFT